AVAMYPDDPKVPDAYSRTMEAFERDRDITNAIRVGGMLPDKIGPGTQWWESNQLRPTAQNRALEVLELGVYGSATTHHERAQFAQKDGDMTTAKAEYAQAIESYRVFLEVYPESEKTYEAQVNLAESLFFSERYPEAAEEYQRLLRYPAGEYYKESAFSLVKSWEQQVELEGGLPYKDVEIEPDSEIEPKAPAMAELTPSAQSWVDASDKYVELFPQDSENPERVPNLLFSAGNVYFSFGQFVKAREYFEILVYQHVDTAAARAASARILDSYRFEQDWVNLSKWAGIVEQQVPPESQEEREVLSAIGSGAAFKNAETLNSQGKYGEAIAAYVAIAANDPGADNAPKALHNAALIYETQTKDLASASQMYVRVGREFPAWERSRDDMFHAAALNEDLLEFDQASSIYELYFDTYPDTADAEKALYNAGLIQEKSKNYARAIAIYTKYVSRFPDSPDSNELAISIARLNEEAGNKSAAQAAYTRFIAKHKEPNGLIEAYYKRGLYAQERGKRRDAEQNFKNAVDIFRRIEPQATAQSRHMAAEARFRMLESDYQGYLGIKLELPAQRMKRLLEDKARRWVALRDAYQEIVGFGDFEYATAAIYRIGAICVEFADTLYGAPIPEGLSPEEEDQYVVILEDQAAPVEQKAEEAFRLNVDKGKQARFRNEWIDKSYDMMVRYDFGIVQEKYEQFGLVDAQTPLSYGPLKEANSNIPTPVEEPEPAPAAQPEPPAEGGVQ
ncbi:MAG: tetratricopeptide repeat protein, partial [Candidatus Alcyoniella australis]|nr:tetratricopeptide repeat protein [Candidatus Alcyoniella australis]